MIDLSPAGFFPDGRPVHFQTWYQSGLRDRESAGRIAIYDSVMIFGVVKAMDLQFARIGSMMFLRTRYPVAGRSYYQESDYD